MLKTHAEATFQIPDITKVLAVPDLLKIYMEPAVAAIAQKIESDLLGLYAGFTANLPVGTPGTAITEATIDSAETALFLAKVPSSEQKFMVVDAATYSAWRQIPRFSEFQTAGDAGLRSLIDGSVGKIKNCWRFGSTRYAVNCLILRVIDGFFSVRTLPYSHLYTILSGHQTPVYTLAHTTSGPVDGPGSSGHRLMLQLRFTSMYMEEHLHTSQIISNHINSSRNVLQQSCF